jgi:glutamyl-tRNA synthetase
MTAKVPRVRFAPSPTGHLHIGGARTALFNYLFARHTGGDFILRVEDTDRERSTSEAVRHIIDGMRWLGLDWDEGPEAGGNHGPYFQTERLEIYKEHADRLLASGKAYYCFCTPDELAAKREAAQKAGLPPKYDKSCREMPADQAMARADTEPRVVRFAIPETGEIVIDDIVKGEVVFQTQLLDDFVILKSDGMPTYNFAAVVDDYLMEITHVIRGDDHISNTPRQILLYQALEFGAPPKFAHMSMTLGPDGARLSKRHGATAVIDYKTQGYLPDALVNYIAFLGWSPGTTKEVFTRDELIKEFTLERVGKSANIFDYSKLLWMNGEYIRMKPLDELLPLVMPFLIEAGYASDDMSDTQAAYVKAVVGLEQERLKLLTEIAGATSYFFTDDFEYDESAWQKIMTQEHTLSYLTDLKGKLETIEPYNAEAIESMMREMAGERGLKTAQAFHPLRVAASGRMQGPSLFHMAEVMGRDRVTERVQRALDKLKG